MKKRLFAIVLSGFAVLALSSVAVLAAETGEAEEVEGGINMVMQMLTLLVVGGILYSLWVGMRGFGGIIGSALKRVGIGIFLISLTTVDAVIETASGFGSENIFGDGELHDFVHQLVPLIGFIILAVGLLRITKFVQNAKA